MEDQVKRWIGREVRLFLHEANQHLPFFLGLASEFVDGDVMHNIGVEEDMDIDEDAFEPSADEVDCEEGDLLFENAAR